ncbi:MAG TPA: GNAT family N-acetyltransferase [Thermomicrobiales bacterium]|nr:GNAT family N-acetyltransferase [Thermomicrobiales bacterium]
MTSRYGFSPHPTPTPDATIAPLRAEDAGRLGLGWSSNFSARELAQHLQAHPGLSWWVPATGEYLIGEPWRHRDEIAAIRELSARLHAGPLAAAFCAGCRERGDRLAVMVDQHEIRRDSFYQDLGFDLLQEILIYELRRLPRPIPPPARLRFAPLTPATHADLLAVDHAAFPWLWRNSAGEFASYGALYGVEIYVGREPGGAPVAYVGLTSYRGWGHLDRIAVIPERQGSGYGLEALNFATAHLAEHGARHLGLSTQSDNIRSQSLYERYGFRRTYHNDYFIYGKWLDEMRNEK